jgi:16S rRNA G966 N2-methylase RsmD
MYNKIFKNKLFPLPPSNHYDNIHIDIESVSYITTPRNTTIISNIICSNIDSNILYNDITIFDGTACVGGDTIAFGNIFGTVISVEIDKKRFDMLKNNISEYGLYNVIPLNDNCLSIIEKINFIDVIYFDPPWGGKNYKDSDNIRLSISNKYIDEIINIITSNNTLSKVKLIVLKLPKNYNIKQLYNLTKNDNIQILLYTLKKMQIIVYKLQY